MLTTYIPLLRITRGCIAGLFLTVIGSQCVWAEAGLKTNGDYDDGTLLWSKIVNKPYTHQDAVRFCIDKSTTPEGMKWSWSLPTTEQMKEFYRIVKMKKTNLPGWTLGMTWSSTGIAANKYEAADLAKGILDWNGPADDQKPFVTCVTSNAGDYFYDGKLTWLKIASEEKTWNEAKNDCDKQKKLADQKNPWRLPTVEELLKFAKEVVPKRKDGMLNNGWALTTDAYIWAGDQSKEDPVFNGNKIVPGSRILKNAKVNLVSGKGPLYIGGNYQPSQIKSQWTCVYQQ